ncbi:hypothetical protein [Sedimentisphaera salicampi]|uniref:hypothetical protein n=1 Tax=Sedimentisphaera salicampi TaxID=1941349 RepID=UPI000B9C0F22|nr:hypothetical protein [Sedimentisphaera salicampi]OXU14258.1 hypothetical protein SMSP1_02024 [Sedimentisphaera salicampi]
MTMLCKDSDLLALESRIFKAEGLEQFIMVRGSGASISGSSLTCGGVDFISAGVQEGFAVYVNEPESGFEGYFSVLSCDGSNQLTIAPPAAQGMQAEELFSIGSLNLLIASFSAVIEAVSMELCSLMSIRPAISDAEFGIEDIIDQRLAANCAAAGTLCQLMLSAQCGNPDADEALLSDKREMYEELFERSKQALIVEMKNAEGKQRKYCFACGDLERG